MPSSPRILVAALALVLTGCGSDSPRPPDPPSSSAPPPADPSARIRRELTTFRELVDADPAIAAAMGLTHGIPDAKARETWTSARAALRHLVARHELARILGEFQSTNPGPEVFAELNRLVLTSQLLGAAHPPEPELLFPQGQEPGLARALARGVEVRYEPAVRAAGSGSVPQERDRYRQALAAEGRTWKVLRALEETAIPDGPAAGFNSRFWRQTPAGERFQDPLANLPAAMLASMYPERDRIRLERATDRIDAPLAPPAGDLVLLLLAWNLHGTTHPVVELVGKDLSLPLVVVPPPGGREALGLPEENAAGLAIRVRKEVLPEGLRKLSVRMVALQPVGRPEASCNATELLQWTGGPLPAVFATHGWASPPPRTGLR